MKHIRMIRTLMIAIKINKLFICRTSGKIAKSCEHPQAQTWKKSVACARTSSIKKKSNSMYDETSISYIIFSQICHCLMTFCDFAPPPPDYRRWLSVVFKDTVESINRCSRPSFDLREVFNPLNMCGSLETFVK